MRMRRVLLLVAGLSLVAVQSVIAASPAETLATIRVPAGFVVELVAEGPLVGHPLMAGFDDRGRLYVADNAGLNLPAEELERATAQLAAASGRHATATGSSTAATTFADKMTFPQGAVWFRGAVYVASPPNIWRLDRHRRRRRGRRARGAGGPVRLHR